MRPAVLASCLAILLATGARAHAEEPPAAETEKSPPLKTEGSQVESLAPAYPPPVARWAVIGVGLATTAFFYGVGAGMSYAYPNAPGAEDLRIPIIGPWKAIANNGCPPGEACSNVWIIMRSIAEGIGGLAQAGGLAIALEGVFMPTQYASERPRPRAPKAPTEQSPSPEVPKPENNKNLFWIPTPMAVGTGGVGVGVVGRF
jgi:hypothetical protein